MSEAVPTKQIITRYLETRADTGPVILPRLADLWATHSTYYNCCGPTETTIVNTMHKHVPRAPLSIGAPTPNNSVYILDDDLEPVAMGSPGVMWAGGLGVSRGYVGLPERTAERYLSDKFARDG